MNSDTHRQHRRLRLIVRAIFALGVLVSLVANVLHANPNPISQAVAAWAPLALFLTVELISRVPTRRKGRSLVRVTATTVVAAIAAWVSYWHMVGVAHRYGETGITPYLLPISVDGLIVVASITLVEISHRLRDVDTPQPPPVTGSVPNVEQPSAKKTLRKRTPAKKTTPRKAPAKKAPATPAPAPQVKTPPVIPTETLTRLAAGNRNGNTTQQPQESLF